MTHRLTWLASILVLVLPAAAAAQFSANTYYHIKPRHALLAGQNLCLDVENVSAYDNAKIQQYTCNPSPQENQLWTLVPVAGSTYRLVAAVSAKCMDVLNPQNGNGAAIQQARLQPDGEPGQPGVQRHCRRHPRLSPDHEHLLGRDPVPGRAVLIADGRPGRAAVGLRAVVAGQPGLADRGRDDAGADRARQSTSGGMARTPRRRWSATTPT